MLVEESWSDEFEGRGYPLRRVRNIVHQVVENLFGPLHASRLEGVVTVPGQEVGAVIAQGCSLTQFDGNLQSWKVRFSHKIQGFASIVLKVSLIWSSVILQFWGVIDYLSTSLYESL